MSKKIGLPEFINALRGELYEAANNAKGEELKLELQDIELEMNVYSAYEGEVGGKVKFWVYEAGASGNISKGSSQKVTLKLKPLQNGISPLVCGKDKKPPSRESNND